MKDLFTINNQFKKYLPLFLIMVSMTLLLGTSYALLRSMNQGENTYVMNVGLLEVTFQDSETNTLTIENMVPVLDEEGQTTDNELTFTIKNTGTLPAKYKVYIEETSTNPEFKNVIRFISNKNNTTYNDPKTLGTDYYIDEEGVLEVGETATYTVKCWLDYSADATYMDKTFTARIVVDVEMGEIAKPTFVDIIKGKYGTDTTLVAVNTSGTLYNGTGEIREYRYSGPTANNYVFFDTNGDGNKTDDEIWRIIGVFKDNQEGEERVRLMRNTLLTSAELPASYVVNGTTYTIEQDTKGTAYWNYAKTGTNLNDWTTAGLQYYLNSEKDAGTNPGYLSFITSEAEAVIAENTYHLGNVKMDYVNNTYVSDTPIEAYNHERGTTVCASSVSEYTYSNGNNCNIWNGNKATWTGKVGLLYLSDYGYSASSTYWSGISLYSYNSGAAETSWMYKTANHTQIEWFVSPSSCYPNFAMHSLVPGNVLDHFTSDHFALRPVLNLISSAKVLDAEGTEEAPYTVVIE